MAKIFLYIIFPGIFIYIIILFGVVYFQHNPRALTMVTPIGSEVPIPTPTSTLYANVLGMSTSVDGGGIENGDGLDLGVESYIVFDRDRRKILFGKNIQKRLPIASLSKIITAATALDNAPLDLDFHVSSAAASVGEATMGLSSGEIISMEDSLYGMMLPSGNDASETIAEGVGKYKLGTNQDEVDGGGARKWFLDAMNENMQKLGLYDSYFFNPSGLDGDSLDETNFSTALDMAILTNYALSNPVFARIVNTEEKDIPYAEGKHKALYLYNILSLDRSYPGIKGVKPGISDFARETLASYIEKDNRRIIVIILGSTHTKDDAVAIYNKIFGTNIGVY